MNIQLVLLASCLIVSGAVEVEGRSLWSDDSPMNYLLTDANASKVGDILTIVVQENNRANDTADGEAEREHNVNGLFSMIFNNRLMQKAFGGADEAPQLSFRSSNDFEGETTVDRSSSFSSRVSATIVRIDPVGNYLVESRKTIRVGEELKTIVLSGKVRPRDVVNNTVFSWQVADAEISYLGEGPLTKMANPTFFQRLFNFLF